MKIFSKKICIYVFSAILLLNFKCSATKSYNQEQPMQNPAIPYNIQTGYQEKRSHPYGSADVLPYTAIQQQKENKHKLKSKKRISLKQELQSVNEKLIKVQAMQTELEHKAKDLETILNCLKGYSNLCKSTQKSIRVYFRHYLKSVAQHKNTSNMTAKKALEKIEENYRYLEPILKSLEFFENKNPETYNYL